MIRLSTGSSLSRPSPAVRNHRTAVRLGSDSVSAMRRISHRYRSACLIGSSIARSLKLLCERKAPPGETFGWGLRRFGPPKGTRGRSITSEEMRGLARGSRLRQIPPRAPDCATAAGDRTSGSATNTAGKPARPCARPGGYLEHSGRSRRPRSLQFFVSVIYLQTAKCSLAGGWGPPEQSAAPRCQEPLPARSLSSPSKSASFQSSG